jgi:hypothetical protein
MTPSKSEVFAQLQQGKLNTELAQMYQVSATTITNWLKKYGLVKNRPKTKYVYDRNFFNTIDTEEKAYVLGFLYADGYINNTSRFLEIRLHPKDRDTLEKIREAMCSNHPITDGTNNNGSPYIQFRIYDKPMLDKLTELGCGQKKSLTLTFPSWLSDTLKHHFVRGYFDGDGCIHIRKNNGYPIVTIIGTENFTKGIQTVYTDIVSYVSPDKNVFRLTFNCSNAISFLDTLYTDTSIYMKRKRDKYTALI